MFYYTFAQEKILVRKSMSNKFESEGDGNYTLLPLKPVQTFHRLLNALEMIGENISIFKDEIIPFFGADRVPQFTFIKTGRFSVYRKDDDLLMHSSYAPSLFGVVEYFQPRNAHFIIADTECDILVVDAALANQVFTKNQLWIDVCVMQTYYIQILQARDFQLIGVNAYLIIKNKLSELMQEPEDVRSRTSVLLYIQLRSKLSKSLISKILSALRVGEYIIMNKGKLVSIKSLPRNY